VPNVVDLYKDLHLCIKGVIKFLNMLSDKYSLLNKLIKIILFSLLFIIFIEIGYYFYYQTISRTAKRDLQLSNYENVEKTTSSISLKSVDPTIVKIQEKLKNPIQKISDSSNDRALDPLLLDGLLNSSKYIKKDVLKSYIITVELEGEITSLDILNKNYIEQYKDLNLPSFLMIIKGKDGGLHQLGLNSSARSSIKIINKWGKPLSLNDLRMGDNILVKIEMDITKSNLGEDEYKWFIVKN
jgi:hypothetical protein